MIAAKGSGHSGIGSDKTRGPTPEERAIAYRENAELAFALAMQSSGLARDTFIVAAYQWRELAALWTGLAEDRELLPPVMNS